MKREERNQLFTNLLDVLESRHHRLPVIGLRMDDPFELLTRPVPRLVPLRPVYLRLAGHPLPPLLRPSLQPPPVVQPHRQDPAVELNAVKLHRRGGGGVGGRPAEYDETVAGVPLRRVVRADENDVLERAELAEEVGDLGFLHPRRQIPHKDLTFLPESGSRLRLRGCRSIFGSFLCWLRQVVNDVGRRGRGWRRGEAGGEEKLGGERVRGRRSVGGGGVEEAAEGVGFGGGGGGGGGEWERGRRRRAARERSRGEESWGGEGEDGHGLVMEVALLPTELESDQRRRRRGCGGDEEEMSK